MAVAAPNLRCERGGAVAVLVVVFDVVVHQRRFVKGFDRQRTALDRFRDTAEIGRSIGLSAGAVGKGIVNGQSDERPRMLAAAGQKVVGDGLGYGHRIEAFCSVAIALGQRRAGVLPGGQVLQHIGLEHRSGGVQ